MHERELATDVRASVSPFESAALFDVWLSAREGRRIETSRVRVERALRRLMRERVKDEELDKVKNRLELGFLAALETIPGKAEQIGFYDTLLGDAGAGFSRLAAYRAVTAAEVQAVARKYLVAMHRTVVVVLPDGTAGHAEADEEDEAGGAMAKAPKKPARFPRKSRKWGFR